MQIEVTDELFLLNLFATTSPFEMILCFIDALHVILIQKIIFKKKNFQGPLKKGGWEFQTSFG